MTQVVAATFYTMGGRAANAWFVLSHGRNVWVYDSSRAEWTAFPPRPSKLPETQPKHIPKTEVQKCIQLNLD